MRKTKALRGEISVSWASDRQPPSGYIDAIRKTACSTKNGDLLLLPGDGLPDSVFGHLENMTARDVEELFSQLAARYQVDHVTVAWAPQPPEGDLKYACWTFDTEGHVSSLISIATDGATSYGDLNS